MGSTIAGSPKSWADAAFWTFGSVTILFDYRFLLGAVRGIESVESASTHDPLKTFWKASLSAQLIGRIDRLWTYRVWRSTLMQPWSSNLHTLPACMLPPYSKVLLVLAMWVFRPLASASLQRVSGGTHRAVIRGQPPWWQSWYPQFSNQHRFFAMCTSVRSFGSGAHTSLSSSSGSDWRSWLRLLGPVCAWWYWSW